MTDLPEIFQARMKELLRNEFDEFVRSLNEPSPVSIRVNPRKRALIHREEKVPWSEFGFYLKIRPVFTLDPAFHAGTYYVQEASSMFLEQVFRQLVRGTDLTVLDLSAAPGGKSTHILSLIGQNSILVSNEVIRSRAHILSENIIKWGHANVIVTNNDPEDFERLPGFFDVIVVDAPCSGEGLFRKDAGAIGEWSDENVALCASRQKRILADVWPALKENGILIYSTCTYNRFENEENLEWLSKNHDVEFLPIHIDPHWGIQIVEEKKIVGHRFLPHRVEGEGFFIAAAQKKETTKTQQPRTKIRLSPVSPSSKKIISPWIEDPEQFQFVQHEELALVFRESRMGIFEAIRNTLKIVHAGTAMAVIKHEKHIPEHALSMSVSLHKDSFPEIAVDHDQAIKFLKRDQVQIDNLGKGFHLITYNQTPLGFINALGNRYNSLYPMEWRIRMQ